MDAYLILKGTLFITAALLVPGVSLTYAIFPRKGDLRSVERFGLSLVLCFVPMVLVYFASKNLNVPVTGASVWASIIGVSVLAAGVFMQRSRAQESS
jgi:uncharacterized membrane protein